MKLTSCVGTSLERIDILKKVGYEYCELSLFGIAKLTDEEFAALKAKLCETGITPLSANGMFPGDINILLGEACYPAVIEYLDKVFPRAKELGIPMIILGSAGARKIPEGVTKEEAENRFCALLTDVISPKAAEYGLMIGIEELNAKECNFINTCKEAMQIIRRVALPNIKLLVDFYHAILGGDTLAEIVSYGNEYIIHCHYGSPINERRAPKVGVDEHLVKEYMELLKSIGYEGGFSLEGKFDDFEQDVTEALRIMSTYN